MRLILILLSLSLSTIIQAHNAASPVGSWITIDDVTGKQKSIIKITENSDHALVGKIIKTFPTPGEIPLKICSACTDEKHNQPILGMIVLTGLKEKDNQWDGGRILDPRNGKYYKCFMQVMDDGKKLKVRGYIGFSLLGRTQIWIRANSG
ncbi:MAG: DUF2147 domain-containing protein [Gammaproteobacteria bacterium]|nr:DUF2147 domain-containing protein [Gammaproteobacteria bacterium]